MLTLEQGRSLIDGALAYAEREGLAPMTAVVLGIDGTIRNVAAQTEACPALFAFARAKAAGALAFRMPSGEIEEVLGDRAMMCALVPGVAEGGMMPAGGAVLFGTADGVLLGAIGLSGDSSDKDEAAARAGVSAAQLHLWRF